MNLARHLHQALAQAPLCDCHSPHHLIDESHMIYVCKYSHDHVVASWPSHYSVIEDENKVGEDIPQVISYTLCHIYAQATHSVSIPATVYCGFPLRLSTGNGYPRFYLWVLGFWLISNLYPHAGHLWNPWMWVSWLWRQVQNLGTCGFGVIIT